MNNNDEYFYMYSTMFTVKLIILNDMNSNQTVNNHFKCNTK